MVDAKDFPLELNIHTGSNPVLTTQKTTKMEFLYPHRASFKNLKQSGGGMVDANEDNC